jgi:hypothetical protein
MRQGFDLRRRFGRSHREDVEEAPLAAADRQDGRRAADAFKQPDASLGKCRIAALCDKGLMKMLPSRSTGVSP